MGELKQMKEQLEIAGRQLVQSDRQHEETRKELEAAINDLKLEIRHIHGDWSDFKEQELFSRQEVWEVIAEVDAKKAGRREMPKLKGEWEGILDRLREEQGNDREKGMLHFI
jgi:chromosome segregation ATPase